MTGRLSGKVALISGGAGGCGLAASRLFAREGAKVGIVDLPKSKGEEVAASIRAEGGQAVFAAADASVSAEVSAAVRTVEAAFGPITVLFNHVELFRGEVEGQVVWPPRGTSGFGYDPVFQPEGYATTFGEMSAEEKHGWKPGDATALSHRARAFKLFAETCLGA